MQNWQQYQQFMPDGMVALFQGKYFWKMPADVKMDVGPTVIHPLPKGYMEATEKYSGQTNLVDLPDGGLTLIGLPGRDSVSESGRAASGMEGARQPLVPLPAASDRRYLRQWLFINSTGNASCEAAQIVNRQLAFNTDPNTPANFPGRRREILQRMADGAGAGTAALHRLPYDLLHGSG